MININLDELLTFATPVSISYSLRGNSPETSWLSFCRDYYTCSSLHRIIVRVQHATAQGGCFGSAYIVIQLLVMDCSKSKVDRLW